MGKSLSLVRTLSMRVFSTFSILPHRGRMAWKTLSRPCLALPPAESPSTMYSSHLAGSSSEQSASFPGRPEFSRSPFLRVSSRALRAASRALAAMIDLSRILRTTSGFSSKNRVILS